MSADELLPGCRLTPLGSRCDVVAAQDVAHSLVRNVMTQVGQRAGNAVVTPTRVLPGEANDQFLYLAGNPRSARISTALKGRYIEPFLGSAAMFFAIQPQRAELGELAFD